MTTKLAQTTSQHYFVLQSLHKDLPSTTLYYKACTKDFPVLLCTTKLAQSTSQYYFVLQSLHKGLPITTLYYKACAKHFPALLCTTKLAQRPSKYYFVLQVCSKHFPVLLCTTKFAQSPSQYYFVLQSLHKALPSTTLYYKACTKHFPVLLCTTKLAQSTSQYYFVLQSLHKALPSTTLYYKACTKHFPVLLCTTKLAQTTSQYYFVLQTDMTTCLETFEKERFCSFPHRHGDATGKPETRDETRGRSKTSISCETSSNFDTFDTLSNRLEYDKVPRLPCKTIWPPAWKPSKRRGFAASPIDTELTTRRRCDADPATTRRRPDEPLEANKGPSPRPPDYKREPFATHSGKTR